MMTRGFRAFLLAAGLLAVWAAPAHAQAIGSIFGKVTDSSGGVLPGVTVTVTGPSLQAPLVATTSENGTYQFPSVPIGTFTVSFELASFKKALRSALRQDPDVVLVGEMRDLETIALAITLVSTAAMYAWCKKRGWI